MLEGRFYENFRCHNSLNTKFQTIFMKLAMLKMAIKTCILNSICGVLERRLIYDLEWFNVSSNERCHL